jgi:hypothetical protein
MKGNFTVTNLVENVEIRKRDGYIPNCRMSVFPKTDIGKTPARSPEITKG